MRERERERDERDEIVRGVSIRRGEGGRGRNDYQGWGYMRA